MDVVKKIFNNLANHRTLLFFDKQASKKMDDCKEKTFICKRINYFYLSKMSTSLKDRISKELEKNNIVLGCFDGELCVGYLCYTLTSTTINEIGSTLTIKDTSCIYIYNIFVDYKNRGRGIQRFLMESVEKEVQKNVRLSIAVLSNNYFSLKNIIMLGYMPIGFVDVFIIFGFKVVVHNKVESNGIEIKSSNLV